MLLIFAEEVGGRVESPSGWSALSHPVLLIEVETRRHSPQRSSDPTSNWVANMFFMVMNTYLKATEKLEDSLIDLLRFVCLFLCGESKVS